MDNRPIGVFDSGVGGMTVLKELMKKMPQESFVYLGDTKRFPYGSKSKQTIIELTKEGMEFLIKKNVKLIVIACGTATSQALIEVKSLYEIPIIGVLEPTTKYLEETGKTNIGIIATAGTIRSKGWEKSILEKIPSAKIQSIPCPLLASMVEEGWYDNQIAQLVINEYLKDLKPVDALVLGCTHYPLLTKVIQKQIGAGVEIINIGTYVAIETEKILKENGMIAENNFKDIATKNRDNASNLKVYLTENECKFNEVASKLIEKEIQAELVKEEIEFS